ncbi:MAG: hypothetical protein ACFB6R_08150 [Alphaproteobacteria bacterium]
MFSLFKLPWFLPTFWSVLFRPLSFYRAYYEDVRARPDRFWTLNEERAGDRYMGPVKFATLAIAFSNLLLPVILTFGVEAGAVSPDFKQFADWAAAEGYLEPWSVTGVWLIDDLIREAALLAVFYSLGLLVALFSAGALPVRFVAGFFFYWNAWSLFSGVADAALIGVGQVVPVYDTVVPAAVAIVINAASVFMLIGFPILFWPRIAGISRMRVVIALLGGLAVWIAVLAVIAPFVVEVPDLQPYGR